MRIRNNFDLDIKPFEWLYIIAAVVIIVLLIRGDISEVTRLVNEWLKTVLKFK
jgi:hypothetical protein